MNFIFKPSLQHIAAVKIVTTLLIQDIDIKNNQFFFFPLTRCKRWDEARDKLIEKVKIMSLPKILERKILASIKPICNDISLWMVYHENIVCWWDFEKSAEKLNLCWTSEGTLDKRKTAEMWIRDEEFDIFKQYQLACIYCLENDIPKLWNRLSEANKEYLYGRYAENVETSKVVIHWTFCLKEASYAHERKSEYSLYRYAFLHAAIEGNKVATEYFFVKLAPEEKKQFLLTTTKRCLELFYPRAHLCKEYFNETLCFLLSQLDEEQQMQVFNKYYYVLLMRLLDWPRQSFFLETFKLVWKFLSVQEFCIILNRCILEKFLVHPKDCNYDEIFKDFWQQNPLTHKKYFFNSHFALDFLLKLFTIKDEKCIQWMLKDATSEEKSNLWCTQDHAICKHLICIKAWNFLELFIRECTPSKDELTKLKRKLIDNSAVQANGLNVDKKDELDRIFKLIEAEISNMEIERSVESDEDSTE